MVVGCLWTVVRFLHYNDTFGLELKEKCGVLVGLMKMKKEMQKPTSNTEVMTTIFICYLCFDIILQ